MKEEKPQYRPDNKRSDLNDLICPNCGNPVDPKHYNEVTELIKCPECQHLFVFDKTGAIQEETEQKTNVVQGQKQPNPTSLYIIAFILLIVALIILAMIN